MVISNQVNDDHDDDGGDGGGGGGGDDDNLGLVTFSFPGTRP